MEQSSFKTKLKRIIKAGFFNFWRSGYVSFSSTIIMVITLSVIMCVIFLGSALNLVLDEIKNKVDVNVYFIPEATEKEILSIKEKISVLPEVQEIQYISEEQALENFKKRHENDQITLQVLEELDDNPLGAILNIKAVNPSEYQGIAEFLSQESILSQDNGSIIKKVNYQQNKVAIDRLSKIIDSSEKLGTIMTLILVAISIIITFNTIRLVIYISREEINVMQLVGASKNYIRGPFVVNGILCGFVSGIITLFIFFPITYWLGGMTRDFLIGFNIFHYYLGNIFQMIFVVIGSGVAIGALSSLIAVKRYLKL